MQVTERVLRKERERRRDLLGFPKEGPLLVTPG